MDGCAGSSVVHGESLRRSGGVQAKKSGLEFGGFGKSKITLGKSQAQKFFNLRLFAVARHGEFADQQVAGAFEHLLFPEGERLSLMESDQALEDSGNLEQRTGPHAVGILLEAVLPVGRAEVVGYGKEVENLLYLAVANHAPYAHAAHIVAGHHHLEAAGLDVKKVKLFHSGADSATANLFDDPYTVVWIHNLVADVKVQITVHKRHPGRTRVE
jgi:hypothetical protein